MSALVTSSSGPEEEEEHEVPGRGAIRVRWSRRFFVVIVVVRNCEVVQRESRCEERWSEFSKGLEQRLS